MKFTLLDKWLSASKDWHIAVSVFIFITGSVIHWLHGIDASYVAFTGVVIGGITGHAYSAAGKPDNPENGQNGQ